MEGHYLASLSRRWNMPPIRLQDINICKMDIKTGQNQYAKESYKFDNFSTNLSQLTVEPVVPSPDAVAAWVEILQ